MCASVLSLAAQKLVGAAPTLVETGTNFRLTYTIDTHDVSDFRAGDIPSGLEVLSGPYASSQSSFQMVNGKTSSSQTVTYTYVLYASAKGVYNIPPAQITANGKRIKSNTLSITVDGDAPGNQQGGGQSGGRNGQRGGQQPKVGNAGSTITSSDLFITTSASKTKVYEQEAILLTYKVYTRVGLNNVSNEAPDLHGFHVQEITLPQQRSLKMEMYKGQAYNTVVWRQYVVFPQRTGDIQIGSVPFEAYVVQRDHTVDPFEAFFNGGSGYIEVKKTVVAPAVTIHVDSLPARPANFSGGVGTFNISATLDKTEVKANEPINLRVVVSGTGNLKLIKEPIVAYPKDFDKYDAKLTDKTKLVANGLEGSMIYDILLVPRHQGKFEIPEIEFVYFDTKKGKYETAKTNGFTINVAKGEGGSHKEEYNKEDIKQLNKDIRHIKTGDAEIKPTDSFFFASTSYWVILAVLILLFISLFVIFRKRAISNADITGMKGKKANKVATRRLKIAAKLMKASDHKHFYDEVLRALWGYVGDKLNIHVAQLTRENISQRLAERDVDENTINLFISALDECEFERYAPGDMAGNMNKTFEAAMTAITTIEHTMKNKSRAAKVTSSVILLLAMTMPVSAQIVAQPTDNVSQEIAEQPADSVPQKVATKAAADSAYLNEDYLSAIDIYENLLETGVSADIYYNLGNAYYRMDDITHAVINYERALLLSPGDEDIRFNLAMARDKTIDRITPRSEMFFVTWYRSLVNMMSVDAWGRTSLFALALAVALALLYLFAERVALRKVGFFGGIVLLLVFIFSNIFAWNQKTRLSERDAAIIISSAVPVKSTPTKSGTDLFILHEGTKVEIIDDTMKDWKEVRVADGKEGWLETSVIELI